MYIPKELQKENCFQDIAIPSNRQLFSRFGQTAPLEQLYSGDEPIPLSQSKSDQIEDFQRYAEQMAKEEQSKSK